MYFLPSSPDAAQIAADCEAIVMAVNCHDDVLGACEWLLDGLVATGLVDHPELRSAVSAARAAIAKAKGGAA